MKFLNKCKDFSTKHSFIFISALCFTLVAVLALGFLFSCLFPTKQEIKQQDLANIKTNKEFLSKFEANPLGLSDPYLAYELADFFGCSVDELNKEQMAKVKELSINGNPYIESVEDLKWFTELEDLSLENCRLTNVSAIFNLKNLKKLDLSQNCINSVEGIENLELLEMVDLSGNLIEDASFLSHLTSLMVVDISGNLIMEIPEIASKESLIELDLAENFVGSLDFMKNNESITSLDISDNNIKNLNDLAGCNNLEKLYLYKYSSMDLTPIENLEKINSIYLSESFDRSKVDFLVNDFANGDIYTRIYLVSKTRGLEVND